MYDLIVCSTSAPYLSWAPEEAIEACMGASNVGLKVALLLLQDGVQQLDPERVPAHDQQGNIFKKLKLLSLYDIDLLSTPNLYTTNTDVRIVSETEAKTLIADSCHHLHF